MNVQFPDLGNPGDWIAEGLIVAPTLPTVGTQIGDCEIRPSKLTWSNRPEPFLIEGSGPGAYASLIPEPAHLRFSASHRITTMVRSEPLESARNIAVQRFARVASLTFLLAGQLAFPPGAAIRFAAIAPTDEPLNRVGDLVEARGGAMPITAMDSNLVGAVAAVYGAAALDSRLGRLVDVWYEADRRAGLAFSEDDWQDVIIRFTRVLEGVGDAMRPGKAELVEAARAERALAVGHLTKVLLGQPVLNDAVDAIREAHSTIRRTGMEAEWAKILSAGVALGLSTDDIGLASAVYKLRSGRGLAHFGTGDVERHDVDDARRAAYVYLTAYLLLPDTASSAP